MFVSSAPFLIGAVLLMLIGIGGAACSFAAPAGRKALTGIGSVLVLLAGIVFLVLPLWAGSMHEVLSAAFGGRTGWIVLDIIDYVFTAGLGTGLILVAIAATRRLDRQSPRFTPHQPYGSHAPGTPYQHGPAQG